MRIIKRKWDVSIIDTWLCELRILNMKKYKMNHQSKMDKKFATWKGILREEIEWHHK